jgi:hypothetical protein
MASRPDRAPEPEPSPRTAALPLCVFPSSLRWTGWLLVALQIAGFPVLLGFVGTSGCVGPSGTMEGFLCVGGGVAKLLSIPWVLLSIRPLWPVLRRRLRLGVPDAIVVAILLVSAVDWVRMWLLGYLD